MQTWADWLDLRLGYRGVCDRMRRRILPDGPSWGYTAASCLFWLVVIQCVTGLLLMATYSPSMSSAWASVHFIDQTAAGRFLRGVHHYTSHAMIIVAGLHVLRVLLTGAYRAPRELVWITGLLLFPLIIVWTVTGNPLSASQKGIAQIQVEGNILGATPFIGPLFQRLLFGGDDIGNLTLTRLYSLHVGFLPLIGGGLCCLHLHQVLKHSSYRSSEIGNTNEVANALPYWPYQSVRNMVTLAVVMGMIGWVAWQHGAPLYAPADPDLPHSPRPEWYFRWLFELRRHFTGKTEFVATMVIPSALLLVLMATPFLDRFKSRRLSSVCRGIIVSTCLCGWGWITLTSYRQDWQDSQYQAEESEFGALTSRALVLAEAVPISEEGAVELLRNDPLTQGPRLFARHCVGCHSFVDQQGVGLVSAQPSAPNLYGIGTVEWIEGFLTPSRIVSDEYFGLTQFRDGDMVHHIQGLFPEDVSEATSTRSDELHSVAVALAAESDPEPIDSGLIEKGRTAITGGVGCTDCHRFHDQGEFGTAPDLTGYASIDWLKQMISKPSHERFYGDRNDRMPEFAPDPAHPELNLLSARELDLLARWLRNPRSPEITPSNLSSSAQAAPARHRENSQMASSEKTNP